MTKYKPHQFFILASPFEFVRMINFLHFICECAKNSSVEAKIQSHIDELLGILSWMPNQKDKLEY